MMLQILSEAASKIFRTLGYGVLLVSIFNDRNGARHHRAWGFNLHIFQWLTF